MALSTYWSCWDIQKRLHQFSNYSENNLQPTWKLMFKKKKELNFLQLCFFLTSENVRDIPQEPALNFLRDGGHQVFMFLIPSLIACANPPLTQQ